MKNLDVLILAAACVMAVASGCSGGGPASPRYRVPVAPGLQRNDVRKILGSPNEIVKDGEASRLLQQFGVQQAATATTGRVAEWYYASGIVATFDGDRLSDINLPAYTSYPGFVIYTGEIVSGVRLKDTRPAVLARLGKPEKVEDDPLPAGTDPNVPEVWPKESSYYWRVQGHLVRVTFLSQAQKLDETHVMGKDAIASVGVNE